MIRCLLVDDDAAIRKLLTDYLGQHGMAAQAVDSGAALRQRLPEGGVDVLVLDLMLPDDNGLALCRWAKRQWPALPVIMLTAQGDPVSRVLGLEMGADDYLAKPFEPRELVARIRATLRRGQAVAGSVVAPVVRFGGWAFDRIERRLQAQDGTLVALSAAEFRLLSAFVDHAGLVLSRERLMELTRGLLVAGGVSGGVSTGGVGGTSAGDTSLRSIDLAVSRLRGKLGDTLQGTPLIRTLRGDGYIFDVKVLT